MPGATIGDHSNSLPVGQIEYQATRQQEGSQIQYSEPTTQETTPNIDIHNDTNNSQRSHITNLPHSQTTTTNNPQYFSQRQRKRFNRPTRSYRSNYQHNMSDGPWGDEMCNKEDDTIRITYQNVNNFQTTHHADSKMERGKDWIAQHDIDIIGWAEVGIAWQKCKSTHKLYTRFKDMRWRQFRSSTSNNKREAFSTRQFGGTATIAINECSSRVTSTGADETGLGRWSWLLLEGRNDVKVRIVTAYNPCKTSPKRPATVYAQHKRYLMSKNDLTCPRARFHIDLCEQIQKWQRQNNRIFLMIDLNENMARTNGPLLQAITNDAGLIDPIKLKHSHLDPPIIQNRGSYQIDGIFVSPKLRNIIRGGWTAFGDGIGDHRAGFIDIRVNDIVGAHKLDIIPRNARRLTCEDPRTMSRYNNHLKSQAKQHNLLSRAIKLQESATFPPNQEQIEELEDLHERRAQFAQEAERKCRKFKSGAVAYAPDEVQKFAY